MRILMADDDIEDLELVGDAILELQPDVKLVKFLDGRMTVDYLETIQNSELPCLIILDYNMPELNGAQVLEQLRHQERLASIPKVVLSTSSALPYMHECMRYGATEYIVKPDSIKAFNKLAVRFLELCKTC